MKNKPILYILIGIPGCGKSTFAKRFKMNMILHGFHEIKFVLK
jgi:predicted kinase